MNKIEKIITKDELLTKLDEQLSAYEAQKKTAESQVFLYDGAVQALKNLKAEYNKENNNEVS